MFRKEYFFIFIVIGLSIVYAFLSFLVFLSRGKLSNLIKRKLAVGTMIIAFTSLLSLGQGSCSAPELAWYDPTSPPQITPECYTPAPPQITPECYTLAPTVSCYTPAPTAEITPAPAKRIP